VENKFVGGCLFGLRTLMKGPAAELYQLMRVAPVVGLRAENEAAYGASALVHMRLFAAATALD
jgi:hypothetical protein